MSRRSRKQASGVKSSKLGIISVLVVLLAVVGVGVIHTMVRKYLRSEEFRLLLSDKVSEIVKADGEFAPFRWDGLAVDTDYYRAKGQGLVRELSVEGMHTEVGLGKIWDGVWQVQGSRVRKIDVMVDSRGADKAKPPVAVVVADAKAVKKKGWMPSEFEVEGVDVKEFNIQAQLDSGSASLRGVQMRVDPSSGNQAYDIVMTGGVMKVPYGQVPPIRLKTANMRYQGNQIFINDLEASVLSNGHLLAAGEVDFANDRFALQGSLEGVKCDELLSENWAKKVSGTVSTSYTVVDRGGKPQASGRLVVRKGVITALPLLDTLAAYADTRRFRVLNISEAHTDWKWRGRDIELTNLVLASEGLVRLEGNLAIRGDKLDGHFRLGLAPGTLATIPGAETDVFIRGERGLMWAPLRITGTLGAPKEDLKARLIAAAGMRLFTIVPETGMKALKFSGRVLEDTPDKIIEGGTKVIEGGVKVIEGGAGILGGAGGLLNDILGGGDKKKDK